MNKSTDPIERIEALELQVTELQRRLFEFQAITVDLRIDGRIRPVVILVREEQPVSPFTVVS